MSDTDQQRLFKRRAIILGGLQGGLLATLIGRMYWLEIHSRDHYRVLSDKNRLYSRLIAPSRGLILDHKGQVMAKNKNAYRAVVVRDQIDDLPKLMSQIADILNLSDEEQSRILRDLKRKPRFVPVTLKENLTWEEVSKVESYLPDLSGISIENGQTRHYPVPEATCHVLGYVGSVSEKEQSGDPLLELPGFRIGKSGIEKHADETLRGEPGAKQVEVNAVRRIVRELDTHPSHAGEDLQLTIDFDLQQAITQRLSLEESAAAVVMDVQTGAVRSLVSTPGFDANLFASGISKTEWDALLNHPRYALINKAISGQYAPGSTFKMIVALAALKEEVATPETSVFCPGYILLGQHPFHCHKPGGHGTIQMQEAIAQSCDVYFFQIAGLLGIDPIAAMAARFGLGTATGIELPNEKPGIVPSRSWKQRLMRQKWTMGETYNASIGQGYVLATPLQLAMMTARLATGKEVFPHLCQDDHANPQSLGLNPEHLKLVQEGMNGVVNGPTGTARSSHISETGWQMAGKTGTTQVRGISLQDRKLGLHKQAGSWVTRDHALFVGYAPITAPQFALSLLIEHGGSGGKIAAPIARDIMILVHRFLS